MSQTEFSEILEPEKEEAMNQALDEQAEEAMEKEFNTPEAVNVGVETEFPVWYENGEPVDEETRNQIVDEVENVDMELGATQVEIGTDPIIGLETVAEIEEEVREVEADLKEVAEAHGAVIGRFGTNPTVPLDSIQRSGKEKYVLVPDVYDELRNENVQETFGGKDTIDPRNEGLPAVLTSTQLNIQAEDLDDAVEKANLGYAVAPYITALAGNSRILDGKDLGFVDVRMQLWEKSFDIRDDWDDELDVGKMESYIQDFQDYVERVRDQPRILNDEPYHEAALDIGQGMFWKDSRIKVMEDGELSDNVLVEFRQNSTQPSPAEDAAVHAFYIGRISYAQEEDEELLGIEKANRNRYAAMHNGLNTKLYSWDGDLVDAEEAVFEELEKARKGLEYAEIDDSGYLDILEDRLMNGMTPSEEMMEHYMNAMESGLEGRKAAARAVEIMNQDYQDRSF